MNTKQQAYLTIRIKGPEIGSGRMRLNDFVRLAEDLTRAVERVAVVLHSSRNSGRPGRPPEELKRAVSLDLAGFTHGSPEVVALLERSEPQSTFEEMDPGDLAFRAFFKGLNTVTLESDEMPSGYDLGVLLKIRDIGNVFSKGINEIEFCLNHREQPLRSTYREEGLQRVRRRIERPEAQESTMRGRLLMADFKETGRQIRIHPSVGQPVVCHFDEALSDEVEESIRRYVEIRGRAEYNERREITSIELSDLERLDGPGEEPTGATRLLSFGNFWEHRSVEQLAAEQGVTQPTDVDSIRGGWPGDLDDGFEEWIEEMRSSQPIP